VTHENKTGHLFIASMGDIDGQFMLSFQPLWLIYHIFGVGLVFSTKFDKLLFPKLMDDQWEPNLKFSHNFTQWI